MDKRQLASAFALSRLVDLVDASPTFREAAQQSAAYAELKKRVGELHDFIDVYQTNRVRLPVLREETRAARRELVLLLESVVAVGELGHYAAKEWLTAFRIPTQRLDDTGFAIVSRGFAQSARKYAEELIPLGMLPGRPDHIDQMAEHLTRLSLDLRQMEMMVKAGNQGYSFMLARARKTARVLFLQVRPFINETMLAEWRQALHLGRQERRALRSPTQRALPGAKDTSADDQTVVVSLEATRTLSPAANE